MKTTHLSPAMINCIRYLAGDKTQGISLGWAGGTIKALERRGLIRDLGKGTVTPDGWDVTAGVALLQKMGVDVILPVVEPVLADVAEPVTITTAAVDSPVPALKEGAIVRVIKSGKLYRVCLTQTARSAEENEAMARANGYTGPLSAVASGARVLFRGQRNGKDFGPIRSLDARNIERVS